MVDKDIIVSMTNEYYKNTITKFLYDENNTLDEGIISINVKRVSSSISIQCIKVFISYGTVSGCDIVPCIRID